jgi:hypothetical protein
MFQNIDTSSLPDGVTRGLVTLIPSNVIAHWVSEDPKIWTQYATDALIELSNQANTSVSQLDQLYRKNWAEHSSYERLAFLKASCLLLRDYVNAQIKTPFWTSIPDIWLYVTLLYNVIKQMRDTSEMLDSLITGKYTITVNFDIFDLTIRKYYGELSALFPVSDEPKRIIDDPAAHACWRGKFGDSLRVVHFDSFMQHIVTPLWPETARNDRFSRYLAYFFNFPRDNFFSVYRFNLLVTLFGPFEQVADNFTKYVLCPGFLGLINMIKAEEILTQLLPQLRRSTVLIRFSRQIPTLLAFSSIDVRTGRVEHRRNVTITDQSVPIGQYLARAFPGYDIIRMGVDDMATKCENIFTFARHSSPYTFSEYSGRSLLR